MHKQNKQMRAIQNNVIAIVDQNILSHVEGTGINLGGTEHNLSGVYVVSVGSGEKVSDICPGDRIIVTKIGLNVHNLIEIGGNKYIRIQGEYIQAASSLSNPTSEELDLQMIFENA